MASLPFICWHSINQLIKFVIMNRSLFWDLFLINFHNSANFIFEESSPMFQRVSCIIFRYLHTSSNAFFVFRVIHFELVDYDTIVWEFCSEICPPNMFSRHFIIVWNEECFFVTNQSDIKVLKPSVIMMKNEIVVQNKQIQYEHEPIDYDYNNSSSKSSFTSLLVIVWKFENFSLRFPHCNINDHNKKRIPYCS